MKDLPTFEDIPIGNGDLIFLCEGKDEVAVLKEVTRDWHPRPKVGLPQDGKSAKDELTAIVAVAKLRQFSELKVGLVADAEVNADTTKKSIDKMFRAAGIQIPAAPLALSTTNLALESGAQLSITASYLINPHGEDAGKLEDLFLPQVRAHDIWPCIEEFMNCASASAASGGSQEKVAMRTYVGYLDGYSSTIYAGIKQGFLDPHAPELEAIAQFAEALRAA